MIRPIESNDYYKGYMELINTFTRDPAETSFEQFEVALTKVLSQNAEIYVIEQDNRIVSSIHLLYEYKLHNNFKLVCHVEDLVTHREYRKMGYASALLEFAKSKASDKNCYKIVLCSNDENKEFYIRNRFLIKGCELSKYL
jgi:glucosamine-phosphate N-acetyltransferase